MLIHPLVVHFPVALWIVSLLFDVLAWYRQDPLYRRAAYWLVGLGLLGAAVSVGSGWLDLLGYERGGVEPGIVRRHWMHSILAYASTVVYLVNFLWRWRRRITSPVCSSASPSSGRSSSRLRGISAGRFAVPCSDPQI